MVHAYCRGLFNRYAHDSRKPRCCAQPPQVEISGPLRPHWQYSHSLFSYSHCHINVAIEFETCCLYSTMWPLIARDSAVLPQAPPGVEPNYINPPTSGGDPVITSLFTLVLAALAVAVRLFTKARIVRETGFDDCELEMLQKHNSF